MAHIPRAMVVEDDPRLRRIVTKVLTSCGMMVRAASDGIDALNAFTQSRSEPELICADIKMPNMDGKEFAKRLRQQGVNVPIIFISGTIQKGQEGYRAKSHIYLMTKPFSPAKLAEIAKELLAKPRPQMGPRLAPPPVQRPQDLPPAPKLPPKGFDSAEFPAQKSPPPKQLGSRPAPPPVQRPQDLPPAPKLPPKGFDSAEFPAQKPPPPKQ